MEMLELLDYCITSWVIIGILLFLGHLSSGSLYGYYVLFDLSRKADGESTYTYGQFKFLLALTFIAAPIVLPIMIIASIWYMLIPSK